MLWKGFQRPKRLEFERETLTDRFGRFYAQPFERGFGTTIGNAVRRVLLSSIEGAAITAEKTRTVSAGTLHRIPRNRMSVNAFGRGTGVERAWLAVMMACRGPVSLLTLGTVSVQVSQGSWRNSSGRNRPRRTYVHE